MIKLFLFSCLLMLLSSCANSKYAIPAPNEGVKRITFVYDQPMLTWPQKSRTDMVVPAFYLQGQQEAFHLFKSEYTKSRALVLEFPMDDDSSVVQVFAKSLEYDAWLYTDTLLSLQKVAVGNTCYKVVLSTYKIKAYNFVPVLQLVPFGCNADTNQTITRKYLVYNASTGFITGSDKKIYLKNGYNDLFANIFFKHRDIKKVSELEKK